jgi:ribosomal protein L37AE/L43A
METNGNQIEQKTSNNYSCKKCNYITVRKPNYERHLLTAKHLKETNGNQIEQKTSNYLFECIICNKQYTNRAGLWKHKNKCIEPATVESTMDKDLILTLIKQNAEQNAEHTKQTAELHATIIEMCKNGITNNSINTTNSHNKTFNLQFFLNETCKDAMNIKDFVNSVVLQLSDIDEIGRVGFVKGMSNIITSKLNLLAENKRPVHCTDAKREVMYVREENKWEKDNANKEKMRLLVKKIDRKLNPVVTVFHKDRIKPNSTDSEHIRHQQILKEVWGGDKEPAENENEIIQNISKKTTIEKA